MLITYKIPQNTMPSENNHKNINNLEASALFDFLKL